MLKLGDKIRLTKPEQANFDNLTGTGKPPATAQEHDAMLENAAQAWKQDGEVADMSAEAELLAMLCQDAKIEKSETEGEGQTSAQN